MLVDAAQVIVRVEEGSDLVTWSAVASAILTLAAVLIALQSVSLGIRSRREDRLRAVAQAANEVMLARADWQIAQWGIESATHFHNLRQKRSPSTDPAPTQLNRALVESSKTWDRLVRAQTALARTAAAALPGLSAEARQTLDDFMHVTKPATSRAATSRFFQEIEREQTTLAAPWWERWKRRRHPPPLPPPEPEPPAD